MFSSINVFAVSGSNAVLEGIENFIKQERKIYFSGYSRNYNGAAKYFNNRNTSSKDRNILFIDDPNFKKAVTINFLKDYHIGLENRKVKTLVYTDSNDEIYMNNLLQSNVRGILHDNETPLAAFFLKQNDLAIMSYLTEDSHAGKDRLLKQTGVKFIETLKLIDSGCVCYDPQINSIITRRYAWARDDVNLKYDSSGLPQRFEKIKKLTAREKEILCKIKEGKSNKEIANELFISVKTVEATKYRVIKKLSLNSTTELIIFSLTNILTTILPVLLIAGDSMQ